MQTRDSVAQHPDLKEVKGVAEYVSTPARDVTVTPEKFFNRPVFEDCRTNEKLLHGRIHSQHQWASYHAGSHLRLPLECPSTFKLSDTSIMAAAERATFVQSHVPTTGEQTSAIVRRARASAD
ncbi:unnamed protein product, partial [Iphiclides podalirius]